MALELRIAGPGLDVSRRVEMGQPALVLGRDPECAVCLPDPERNVSRRHLSVWNEGNELHFHVLSVVNGIEMPFGEAPPGARGVLPLGQTLKLAEYSLTVQLAAGGDAASAAQPGEDTDPWAALEAHSGAPAGERPLSTAPGSPEADPFGDWGFETTFGADIPGGGLQASGLQAAEDVSAFYRGLGLDPAEVGVLSQGELESVGRLVRSAVLGLVQMHRSIPASGQRMGAEEGTLLAPHDRNPLREGGWPDATILRYLFGGRAAGGTFVAPERAVRELVGDLQVHLRATAAAARAAVDGTLREFEPEALKERLGAGGKLFGAARAWDAYVRHYNEQKADFEPWVQRLLDKHFSTAYLRESRIPQEGSTQKG
ncbi:MAG TPA: type VI secretion system-associated FHA domain protein [Ramlibacter sp.]|nr:type VI secretion system-associated FHA domain protein [Ramlibacter sp.]